MLEQSILTLQGSYCSKETDKIYKNNDVRIPISSIKNQTYWTKTKPCRLYKPGVRIGKLALEQDVTQRLEQQIQDPAEEVTPRNIFLTNRYSVQLGDGDKGELDQKDVTSISRFIKTRGSAQCDMRSNSWRNQKINEIGCGSGAVTPSYPPNSTNATSILSKPRFNHGRVSPIVDVRLKTQNPTPIHTNRDITTTRTRQQPLSIGWPPLDTEINSTNNSTSIFSALSRRQQSVEPISANTMPGRFFHLRENNAFGPQKIKQPESASISNRFDISSPQPGQSNQAQQDSVPFAAFDSIMSQNAPQQSVQIHKQISLKPNTSHIGNRTRYRNEAATTPSNKLSWEQNDPNSSLLLQKLIQVKRTSLSRNKRKENQTLLKKQQLMFSNIDRAKRLQSVNHSYTVCSTDENIQLPQQHVIDNMFIKDMRSDQVQIQIDPLNIVTYNLSGQKNEIVNNYNRHRLNQITATFHPKQPSKFDSATNEGTNVISSPGSPKSLNSLTNITSNKETTIDEQSKQLSPSQTEQEQDKPKSKTASSSPAKSLFQKSVNKALITNKITKLLGKPKIHEKAIDESERHDKVQQERQRLLQQSKKYFIYQTPKQIIQFLDRKIATKNATYHAEIKQDAIDNDLIVDDYFQEVTNFVERRLKYHFREQYKTFLEPMISNKQNCALHHIPAYSKIDFENGKPQPKQVLTELEMKVNPPGINMICTHCTLNERRLRQIVYDQYKQLREFKRTNRIKLEKHMSREETVKQLCANLYDMQSLSEKEKELFTDAGAVERLLLDPLTFLLKVEIRQEEKIEAEKDKYHRALVTDMIDNKDKSIFGYDDLPIEADQIGQKAAAAKKYVPTKIKQESLDKTKGSHSKLKRKVQLTQEQIEAIMDPKETFLYTTSPEAQEYISKMQKLFDKQDDEPQKAQNPATLPIDLLQPAHKQRYLDVYNQFIVNQQIKMEQQIYCDAQTQIKYVEQIIDNKQLKQANSYDSVPEPKPTWQVEDLLNFLNDFYKRNLKTPTESDCSDSDSQQEVQQVEVREDKYPIQVKDMLKQRQGVLSQTVTAAFKKCGKESSILDEVVVRQRFNTFVKTCLNESITNDEERQFFQTFNEFQKEGALPWPIFAKIRNQKLVLEKESFSATECRVIGKYLQWTKQFKETNIKVLEIKDCGLSDQQISDILQGILAQEQIISINIFNEKIDKLTIEALCQFIKRPRPNSLLELQMIGCQFISHSTMKKLLTCMNDQLFLSKLTLSNFTIKQRDYDETIDSELCQYLQRITDAPASMPNVENLTHLDLSYLNLSPITLLKIMQILSYNQKLQFLNLAGNKVTNSKEFDQSLLGFLETNTKNITHLDIRDMGYQPDLQKLFEQINGNKSLQVFHFDSHQCEQIYNYTKVRSDFKHLKQTLNSYTTHMDTSITDFIEKNGIKHLIEPVNQNQKLKAHVIDGVLNRIAKETKSSKTDTSSARPDKINKSYLMVKDIQIVNIEKEVENKTQESKGSSENISEPQASEVDKIDKVQFEISKLNWKEIDNIGSSATISHTLSRELSKGSYRTQFQIEDGRFKQSFKPITDWSLDSQPCKYCNKLQYVHVHFNVFEDRSNHSEGFIRIQSPQIIEMLNRYIPQQSKDKVPIIFGSLTNWQIYCMAPLQLYTINLLLEMMEDKLTDWKEITQDVSSGDNKQKLDQIQQSLVNYHAFYQYARSQIHYEFFQYVQQIGTPSQFAPQSFMIQSLVPPGKHNIIVFDPNSGNWYCREVIIDAQRGPFSFDPSFEVPKVISTSTSPSKLQLPEPSHFDFNNEKIKMLDFLEDMKPSKIAIDKSSLNLEVMIELYDNYEKINALFQLFIDQKSREGTEESNKEKETTSSPTLGAESKEIEKTDSDAINQVHTETVCLSTIAKHFKRTVPRNEQQINRQQFVHFVFKKMLKGIKLEPFLKDI